MENIVIVVILAAIVAGIVWYLLRAKKRGQTCIGCPHSSKCASKKCSGKCNGGCGSNKEKTKD